MANTYTLISSNVLSASAASVTFSAIPSTYTDLVLRVSARGTNAADASSFVITFNASSATNYSGTRVIGYSTSSTLSSRDTSVANFSMAAMSAGNNTANTFGSMEMYVPNYTSTTAHPISFTHVTEDNSTSSFQQRGAIAGLWSLANAITSIELAPISGSFTSGSSFYLYGIKKN